MHVTGKFVEPWFTSMKMWIMNLKIHAPGAGATMWESLAAIGNKKCIKSQ
jgi:hypothetical protein